MRIDLDSPVAYADGAVGELADVVIDPGQRQLTHLVVQPPDRHDLARLVPVTGSGIAPRPDGTVAVEVTVAEVNELEPLHRSDYLRLGERPPRDPGWDVGIEEVRDMPSYGSLGTDGLGGGMMPIEFDPHATVSYDRVPAGLVELRRDSGVTSSDGHHVGHVVGLVLDERLRIAELVLSHGHLWSKREIALPARAIDRLESDEVILNLSHEEVGRSS
jgi:sporulation protein YlmC with PRC-barrel domain